MRSLVSVPSGGSSSVGTGVGSALLGVVKYMVLLVVSILLRNTNPRLRIDQTVRFFWLRLAPAAIVAVVLSLVGISKGLSWL